MELEKLELFKQSRIKWLGQAQGSLFESSGGVKSGGKLSSSAKASPFEGVSQAVSNKPAGRRPSSAVGA